MWVGTAAGGIKGKSRQTSLFFRFAIDIPRSPADIPAPWQASSSHPAHAFFHGHEWIYATEIKKSFGNPQPGDVITLKDFRDRPLGTAIYNPQSQIVARRFSRRKQDLDLDFFTRRIGQGHRAPQTTRHR
jgi:hypothetical protein